MKIQNRSRICLCVSAGIMVLALVLSLCGLGINYGIDFAGGLNIQYNMGAAFDQADVKTARTSRSACPSSAATTKSRPCRTVWRPS